MNLNFVQMLQDIAQEANFVVTYVDIEELSVSGKIWKRERLRLRIRVSVIDGLLG